METVYIAQHVLEAGGKRYVPGDVIPDAEDWPTLKQHLSLRWIERVRSMPPPDLAALQKERDDALAAVAAKTAEVAGTNALLTAERAAREAAEARAAAANRGRR